MVLSNLSEVSAAMKFFLSIAAIAVVIGALCIVAKVRFTERKPYISPEAVSGVMFEVENSSEGPTVAFIIKDPEVLKSIVGEINNAERPEDAWAFMFLGRLSITQSDGSEQWFLVSHTWHYFSGAKGSFKADLSSLQQALRQAVHASMWIVKEFERVKTEPPALKKFPVARGSGSSAVFEIASPSPVATTIFIISDPEILNSIAREIGAAKTDAKYHPGKILGTLSIKLADDDEKVIAVYDTCQHFELNNVIFKADLSLLRDELKRSVLALQWWVSRFEME